MRASIASGNAFVKPKKNDSGCVLELNCNYCCAIVIDRFVSNLSRQVEKIRTGQSWCDAYGSETRVENHCRLMIRSAMVKASRSRFSQFRSVWCWESALLVLSAIMANAPWLSKGHSTLEFPDVRDSGGVFD